MWSRAAEHKRRCPVAATTAVRRRRCEAYFRPACPLYACPTPCLSFYVLIVQQLAVEREAHLCAFCLGSPLAPR
jgi:hypothetical protein